MLASACARRVVVSSTHANDRERRPDIPHRHPDVRNVHRVCHEDDEVHRRCLASVWRALIAGGEPIIVLARALDAVPTRMTASPGRVTEALRRVAGALESSL